jgi:hypothetical protein
MTDGCGSAGSILVPHSGQYSLPSGTSYPQTAHFIKQSSVLKKIISHNIILYLTVRSKKKRRPERPETPLKRASGASKSLEKK